MPLGGKRFSVEASEAASPVVFFLVVWFEFAMSIRKPTANGAVIVQNLGLAICIIGTN